MQTELYRALDDLDAVVTELVYDASDKLFVAGNRAGREDDNVVRAKAILRLSALYLASELATYLPEVAAHYLWARRFAERLQVLMRYASLFHF